MNNIKIEMEIWGRKFDIRIVIQNYPGEEILLSQGQSIIKMVEDVSFIDQSKEIVEQYILDHHPESVELQTIDNIFKYVIPKTITIARSEKRKIALLCNFKFDMEHGLAIVFENEQFKMIGEQDIAL